MQETMEFKGRHLLSREEKRKGGMVSSDAKRKTARENGKKGGKPKGGNGGGGRPVGIYQASITCTCDPHPDGRHRGKCRIYQTEYKRRQRQKG